MQPNWPARDTRMKTTPRYNGASAVAKSLQRYADRGVFRGLSTSEAKNGRREFRFLWLTREPMHVTYDPVGSSLTFTHLFPNAVSVLGMAAGLKGVVTEHQSARVPKHRRIDSKRARVRTAVRQGHLSLSVVVRGSHHAYAVQTALNLVNRLFLHLQGHFPEYLVQRFGFSEE